MTLPQVTSRNQVQVVAPNNQLTVTNVDIGDPTQVLYTVPAAIVTEIISLAWRAQMGGGTEVDLTVSGQRVRRATADEPSLTDEASMKGFIMTAGQTINGDGNDAGDNGTINLIASLKERAA